MLSDSPLTIIHVEPNGIGTKFADAHPDLNLRRNCAACVLLLNRINSGQIAPERAALQIVANSHRKGLLQFGDTRKQQQTAIADELRELERKA